MKKLSTTPIVEIRSDDYDDDYYNFEDEIKFHWDRIFTNKYDEILVTGTMGLWWNGSREVSNIIYSIEYDDFKSKLANHDSYEYEFYSDHVKVTCHHHDGTNYYSVRPYNWNMLTVKEIYKVIEKEDVEDCVNDYIFKNNLRKSKLTKVDLLDFIEDYLKNVEYIRIEDLEGIV